MVSILTGDCLDVLPTLEAESVQCCVTSPPYWGLRDYGCEGQLGLEPTPEEYLTKMVRVFREVWRVLRKDGTLWVNIGDSYAGIKVGNTNGGVHSGLRNDGRKEDSRLKSNDILAQHMGEMSFKKPLPPGLKTKDLCGIPWRLAFALQSDGWYLRSDIIWHKPNTMPESVTDRPTKSHEYIFLLSKQEKYFYDADAIREPPSLTTCGNRKSFRAGGAYTNNDSFNNDRQKENQTHGNQGVIESRNKRSVWTVATQPYAEAHFATFPEDLIKPCILAGSRVGDLVLDPFAGSGTTGHVSLELGRRAVLIELNPQYVEMINKRTDVTPGMI